MTIDGSKCIMRRANDKGIEKNSSGEWTAFKAMKEKDTYIFSVDCTTSKAPTKEQYKFAPSCVISPKLITGRYKLNEHLKWRSFQFYKQEGYDYFERVVVSSSYTGRPIRRRLSGFSPQFIGLVE